MLRVPILIFMALSVAVHFGTVSNAPTDGDAIRPTPAKNMPPLIFPTDQTQYNINMPATNSTALHILQNSQIKQIVEKSQLDTDQSVSHDNPKDDAEMLDVNNEVDSPAQLEEQYGSHKNNHLQMNEFGLDDDSVVDHPSSDPTNVTIITATTLAVLCVCAILGSLIWRQIVQRKYGMRERLVTEDYYTLEK